MLLVAGEACVVVRGRSRSEAPKLVDVAKLAKACNGREVQRAGINIEFVET